MALPTPCQFVRLAREGRYVELRLQQDLFGWVVIRTSGDGQGGRGEMKTTPCADYPEAIHLWNHELRARKRRGYVPVDVPVAAVSNPEDLAS